MLPTTLSFGEAGYLLERSPRALHKYEEKGVIQAVVQGRGRARRSCVGPAELRFLQLARQHGRDLTPKGQRRLYEAVRAAGAHARRVEHGLLTVDLAAVDRVLETRHHRLQEVKAMVEERPDAEPLLRGTDVSVYVIAGLARGQSTEEILEDYPSLSQAQVESAVEYATAYPKPGRPYPSRSFKRMLADLSFPEVDPEPTGEGPRCIPG